jgi:hypothetical protein
MDSQWSELLNGEARLFGLPIAEKTRERVAVKPGANGDVRRQPICRRWLDVKKRQRGMGRYRRHGPAAWIEDLQPERRGDTDADGQILQRADTQTAQ